MPPPARARDTIANHTTAGLLAPVVPAPGGSARRRLRPASPGIVAPGSHPPAGEGPRGLERPSARKARPAAAAAPWTRWRPFWFWSPTTIGVPRGRRPGERPEGRGGDGEQHHHPQGFEDRPGGERAARPATGSGPASIPIAAAAPRTSAGTVARASRVRAAPASARRRRSASWVGGAPKPRSGRARPTTTTGGAAWAAAARVSMAPRRRAPAARVAQDPEGGRRARRRGRSRRAPASGGARRARPAARREPACRPEPERPHQGPARSGGSGPRGRGRGGRCRGRGGSRGAPARANRAPREREQAVGGEREQHDGSAPSRIRSAANCALPSNTTAPRPPAPTRPPSVERPMLCTAATRTPPTRIAGAPSGRRSAAVPGAG